MKKFIVSMLAMLSLAGAAFAAEDVGIVDLSFCDGANHLVMTLSGDAQTADICMNITNKGSQNATISLFFVEGEVSHGDRPTQACKTTPDGFFGKSVTLSGESMLNIAPGQTIQKIGTFNKIPGYVGVLHGCITYSVVDPEAAKVNAPMAIVTRKANLIDIIIPGNATSKFFFIPLIEVPGNETKVFDVYGEEVGGDEKVKLFYSKKEKVLRTLMGIKNDGFADEDYKVDIKFTSLFGLIHWEDIGNVSQLYAQTSTMAEQVSLLPWYHLFVNANVGITHRPQAIGDAPAGEWLRINYNYSFLLVPWYALAGGAVLLVLLVILLIVAIKRKRRKNRMKKMQNMNADEQQPSVKVVKPRAPRKAPVKKAVAKTTTATPRKPRAKKLAE